MKEVCCEDCKWLIGTLYCTQLIKSKRISLEKAAAKEVEAGFINMGSHCPFYTRKWWKFWVTRGKNE